MKQPKVYIKHLPVGFNIEFLSDFVVIGNIYRDRVKKEKNNG